VSRASFSAVSPRALQAIRRRLKQGPAEEPPAPADEPVAPSEKPVEPVLEPPPAAVTDS
jgi:hypothetical protein